MLIINRYCAPAIDIQRFATVTAFRLKPEATLPLGGESSLIKEDLPAGYPETHEYVQGTVRA
jgi:hypothetical protein